MLEPFESARLKIARARVHISEVDKSIQSYWGRKPISIVVEQPAHLEQVGTYAWCAKISEPVPINLSPVIGDALHNLRTALDLLASDLAILAGRDPDRVYFPFSREKEGLEIMIKQKNFHRVGPSAVKLLKQLEPYSGGNDGLRALHDLDIMDKHQAIIPVAQGVSLDMSGLAKSDASDEVRNQLANWSTRIDKDGQEIVVLPSAWGPPLGSTIKAEFVLTLEAPSCIAGYEVIALLNEFARVVETIVFEFEGAVS